MKIKVIRFIICILVLCNGIIVGQNNFNCTDSLGRKIGYWKIFYDGEFSITDSTNAYYYAYSYYDEGKEIIFYKKPVFCPKSIQFNGTKGAKGIPAAANGTLIWKCKRREAKSIFVNGFLKLDEETTGISNDGLSYKSKSIVYLDKKYEGIEGSYLYESIKREGKIVDSSYYIKKNGKWQYIKN